MHLFVGGRRGNIKLYDDMCLPAFVHPTLQRWCRRSGVIQLYTPAVVARTGILGGLEKIQILFLFKFELRLLFG